MAKKTKSKEDEIAIKLKLEKKEFKRKMREVSVAFSNLRSQMRHVSRSANRMLLVMTAAFAAVTRWASNQEAFEAALDASLRSTGQSLGLWSQKLKDASSEIQQLTIHGDEFIQSLMAQLTNLGVLAPRLDEATRGSIGLATALGQDMKTGVRNYALALNGTFTLLAKYVPEIRTAKTATEKLAITQALAARGWQQARVQVETFRGRLIQLNNDIGDLAEVLGEIWLPTVKDFITTTKAVLKDLPDWIRENTLLINTFLSATVATLGLSVVTNTLISAYTGLSGVFQSIKFTLKFIGEKLFPLWAGWVAVVGTAVTAGFAAAAAFGSIWLWSKRLEVQLGTTSKAMRAQIDLFEELHRGSELLKTASKIDNPFIRRKLSLEAIDAKIVAANNLVKISNARVKAIRAESAALQEQFNRFARERGASGVPHRVSFTPEDEAVFNRNKRLKDQLGRLLAQKEKLKDLDAGIAPEILTEVEFKRLERAEKTTARWIRTLELQNATLGLSSDRAKEYGLVLDRIGPKLKMQLNELLRIKEAREASNKRVKVAEGFIAEARKIRESLIGAKQLNTEEIRHIRMLETAQLLSHAEAEERIRILNAVLATNRAQLETEGLTDTFTRIQNAALRMDAGSTDSKLQNVRRAQAQTDAENRLKGVALRGTGLLEGILELLTTFQASFDGIGKYGT